MSQHFSGKRIDAYWWLFFLLGLWLFVCAAFLYRLQPSGIARLAIFFQIAILLSFVLDTVTGTFRNNASGGNLSFVAAMFDLSLAALLFVKPVEIVFYFPIIASTWLLFRNIAALGRTLFIHTRSLSLRILIFVKCFAGVGIAFMALMQTDLEDRSFPVWMALASLTLGLHNLLLAFNP